MLMFDLLGERRSHITGSNCTSVNYNVVEMLQASSHSLRASAQQIIFTCARCEVVHEICAEVDQGTSDMYQVGGLDCVVLAEIVQQMGSTIFVKVVGSCCSVAALNLEDVWNLTGARLCPVIRWLNTVMCT
jgi:hypothetical protein